MVYQQTLGKLSLEKKNWINFVSLSTFPCFRFCTDRLMIWFALKPGGLLVSICCVYCSVSSEKHCRAVQASAPRRETLRHQKCSRRENLFSLSLKYIRNSSPWILFIFTQTEHSEFLLAGCKQLLNKAKTERHFQKKQLKSSQTTMAVSGLSGCWGWHCFSKKVFLKVGVSRDKSHFSKDLPSCFRFCKTQNYFEVCKWSLLEKVTYLNQNVLGRFPTALV